MTHEEGTHRKAGKGMDGWNVICNCILLFLIYETCSSLKWGQANAWLLFFLELCFSVSCCRFPKLLAGRDRRLMQYTSGVGHVLVVGGICLLIWIANWQPCPVRVRLGYMPRQNSLHRTDNKVE